MQDAVGAGAAGLAGSGVANGCCFGGLLPSCGVDGDDGDDGGGA